MIQYLSEQDLSIRRTTLHFMRSVVDIRHRSEATSQPQCRWSNRSRRQDQPVYSRASPSACILNHLVFVSRLAKSAFVVYDCQPCRLHNIRHSPGPCGSASEHQTTATHRYGPSMYCPNVTSIVRLDSITAAWPYQGSSTVHVDSKEGGGQKAVCSPS